MRDQSLCLNCDHWREEHYAANRSWRGDKLEPQPCAEYLGTIPSRERLARRQDETSYLHPSEVSEV